MGLIAQNPHGLPASRCVFPDCHLVLITHMICRSPPQVATVSLRRILHSRQAMLSLGVKAIWLLEAQCQRKRSDPTTLRLATQTKVTKTAQAIHHQHQQRGRTNTMAPTHSLARGTPRCTGLPTRLVLRLLLVVQPQKTSFPPPASPRRRRTLPTPVPRP